MDTALKAFIDANINNPKAIYDRVFMELGYSVDELTDRLVGLLAPTRDVTQTLIVEYFTQRNFDPYRMENIKNSMLAGFGYNIANADKIYRFVDDNNVTYNELMRATGWSKAQIDAILLEGAKKLGLTPAGTPAPAPAPAPAPGGSSYLPGGSLDFDSDFFSDNKPILIGAGLIVGALILRRMQK